MEEENRFEASVTFAGKKKTCFCVLIIIIILFGAHARKLAALKCLIVLGECFADPSQRDNVETSPSTNRFENCIFHPQSLTAHLITLTELLTDF